MSSDESSSQLNSRHHPEAGTHDVRHQDSTLSSTTLSSTTLSSTSAKINISRDEMNLSEFPLTVLSTRASTSIKTLEFKDSIRGKNGETINRTWIITGADKFGLPTSSDDEVLLGLLKLTVDRQFASRKVLFSRYELLKNLRWSTEGRSYSRLQRALDRLSGVRIKASNAFFDNEAKSHSTKNFGIIDGYELNDGRDNDRPSFFSWSEVIFRSFQAGFIKKLDLDFYLGLKSSVSKRLYRFLDKHFWYRSKIQMNFFIFAHEKIGVSRTYQFVSSMRQQIDPALDELKEVGFIKDYEYSGQGKGTEIIILAASGKPRVLTSSGVKEVELKENGLREKESRDESSQAISFHSKSRCASDSSSNESTNSLSELRGKLIQRGITAQQVHKLLALQDDVSQQRIEKIILHFDYLMAQNSTLVSKNPIGFLYRAVQNPLKFQLPEENKREKQSGNRSSSSRSQKSPGFNQASEATAARLSTMEAFSDKHEALKARYLVERKQEVGRLKSEVEQELVLRIRKEVEVALHKLKTLISEARFQEAVEHGVEEKLAKLFAFPDFEEWSKGSVRRTLQ